MDKKLHWDNLYANTLPEAVSWFQIEPTTSLELITKEALSTDAAIIDVGGGASPLSLRLFDAGYKNLTVLDISAIALNYAQARFGELANRVNWIESDIIEFNPHNSYCVWHDRAVFHFLTEAEDRAAYVDILNNTLSVGGYLVIAAFAIGGPERCSGVPIMQHDFGTLSQELGDGYRLLEQRSELHSTPDGTEQQFNYFRFIRER